MIEMVAAYREAKARIKDKRAKDLAYKQLVGEELNYVIIKDLVNAARHDVKIKVSLRGGASFEITRVDAFDKLQKAEKSDLY
jgi:hypothetical protein